MKFHPDRTSPDRRSRKASPWGNRGQAFVELALVMIVLILIAIGGISMAQMLSTTQRMASVARETGRQISAFDYDTNNMYDVFRMATNMVYPSQFNSDGKIVVSFVKRVAGNDVNNATTSSNDVIRIIGKFYYPSAGGTNLQTLDPLAPNNIVWPSNIPEPYTNSSGLYLVYTNNVGPVTLDMLQLGSTTAVIVEVFYTNRFSNVIRNLGVNPTPYVYEVSVF